MSASSGSGRRYVPRSRRHLERGAAGRAGRQPRESPAHARRRAGAARPQGRGLRLRDGHQPGRPGHARAFPRIDSTAPTSSSWSCSPRRASSSTRCSSVRISSARTAPAASPRPAWWSEFLAAHAIDTARSFMIGDRDTDLEFAANLGVAGPPGTAGRRRRSETWPAIAARILGAARRARVHRKTKETDVQVDLDLSREGPCTRRHRPRLLRSHAGADREARRLCARSQVQRRSAHRRASHGRGLRARRWAPRCARRWATSAASRATGSCSPWTRPRRRWRSICRAGRIFVCDGRFERERVGDLPTELVPHFFRSLAEALGAALHVTRARREQPSHDRSLLQGRRPRLRQAIRREGGELPSTKGVL